MKFTRKTWLAIAAGALLASPVAIASDHTDGSQATSDPAADITDLYAFLSDDSTLTMIMDVNKAATSASAFSDTVKYTFHISPHGPAAPGNPATIPALGGTTDPEVDVICTFTGAAQSQTISCWVATGVCGGGLACAGFVPNTIDYVTGPATMDPSSGGLVSTDGLLTVYAGLASDPFFFNLVGFQATAATVAAVAPTLTAFTPAGCPLLPPADVTLLDTQLTTGVDGGTPTDNFAGLNVNAIVVQLDLSLALSTGPDGGTDTLASVWASTNN